MRLVLLSLLLLFLTNICIAGSRTEAGLRKVSYETERALVHKDTDKLNIVLHSKVKYGHSNGWVEGKEELKKNLYNGKLEYKAIDVEGEERDLVIEDNLGLVRAKTHIEVRLDGKPLLLELMVLQVWIFENNEWRLIARHSSKL